MSQKESQVKENEWYGRERMFSVGCVFFDEGASINIAPSHRDFTKAHIKSCVLGFIEYAYKMYGDNGQDILNDIQEEINKLNNGKHKD